MTSFSSTLTTIGTHHHPLLEREGHLSELERRLADAKDGHGGVVLLGGNAGIGKTALVREFSHRAGKYVSVLAGACDALSTKEPLAPLFEIAAAAGRDSRDLLAGDASRLARFRAFLELLGNARRPRLVIFEDAHWADEATLDLLRFTARRIGDSHALLIATYRDDEVGPNHPLRILFGDLAMLGSHHRMSLPPLSAEAVTTLAKDSDVDPIELHRLTGGNPFFVTEVLAAGAKGIPPTVRDAVAARASRLTPNGRATLDTAAVVGSPGEIWLLSSALEPGTNAIDECVASGMLIASGDTYLFRHEIARQAILDALAPQHRITLHHRALTALEQAEAGRSKLARLAHHAEECGQQEAVLHYAPMAAWEASRLGAHREAAEQFARVLRYSGRLSPEHHAGYLEAFAQECYVTDRMEAAIEARREALAIWRNLGAPLKEGENLYRMARALVLAGLNAEAEEASQQAIAVLKAQPPSPELASAYQIQAHLRMLNRDMDEAVEQGTQAIELAEMTGATEALTYAHNTVGSALILSREAEGRSLLERSLEMALELENDDLVAAAYGNLGSGSGEIYRFEQADRYLATGIAYCEDRDLDFERNYMLAWQALSHFYQGRWTEASDVASQLLRLPNLSAISDIMARVALARVRSRRGDPEVMPILDLALETAQQTATLQRLAPVHAARAEAAWLRGDLQEATREAREVYDLALAHKHPWHTGELAHWLWKAGDLDRPPRHAAEPFALQIKGRWRAAAARWRSLNCPYEAARALSESKTESALRQAFDEFDKLGAAPAKAAVAQRLRSLGAHRIPRGALPSTRSNPAQLTRRQVEVAELLAAGCTNTQIADRLFISPKTVEHHVSALFTKLSVSNRIEAARELARLGISSE